MVIARNHNLQTSKAPLESQQLNHESYDASNWLSKRVVQGRSYFQRDRGHRVVVR